MNRKRWHLSERDTQRTARMIAIAWRLATAIMLGTVLYSLLSLALSS